MSTVCLAMMARNEAATIERALLSARPWVDAACVVDTGSEDNTIAIARDALGGLPFKVLRRKWKDFAHGRTQTVKAAAKLGTDYILVMDADQSLCVPDRWPVPPLGADYYNVAIHHAGLVYPHPWLLKASLPWEWKGATHEALMDMGRTCGGTLAEMFLLEHGDSHRRVTGAKQREDRALLEAAYEEDPTDARTVFYLGQGCHDVGNFPCAINWYTKRVQMGGWQEEAWCAQYRIGACHEGMGNHPAAVHAYLAAYQMMPTRAEPLFRVGNLYYRQLLFHNAKLFFEAAAQIDKPVNGLFVEPACYDYAALQGYAWCCRTLNQTEDAQEAEAILFSARETPEAVKQALRHAIETRTIKELV